MFLGMTQADLGAALDISQHQVGKYEIAKNRIASSLLYRVAEALGVDVSYFFEDLPDEVMCGLDHQSPRPVGSADEAPSPQERLDLVRTYYAIDDAKVRRNVLDLMQSLSGEEEKGT